MQKLCKICNQKPVSQYSIIQVCWEKCYQEYQRQKKERKEQLKNDSKIVIDERKKNQVRVVSEVVKRRVYERDKWVCVFCHKHTKDHFHHILWWQEAEYWIEKNYANKLVLACHDCHTLCHHSDKSKEYREKGKKYIEEYYRNTPYKH